MSADKDFNPENQRAKMVLSCGPAFLRIQQACHKLAVESGWWTDPDTGHRTARNVGELLALVHSEISEALEGFRKGQPDKHLPHRDQAEVELADAVIRILDLADFCGYDIGRTIAEKLEYNANRADHKLSARRAENGKKF